MLLKPKRSLSRGKFNHPNSQAHKNAMQIRAKELQNVYVPKDKRLEKKMENQRAHFIIGGNEKMPSKSYGQDLISQAISQQQLNNDNEASDRTRMMDLARKSNFKLGESGQTNARGNHHLESSSRAAYDNLQNANGYTKAAIGDVQSFKKANFKLGSNNTKYTTTNSENYNGLPEKNNTSAQVEQAVIKMKQQHFNYGHDVPQYVSTFKSNYPQHSINNMDQNKIDQRQKSLKFREAQFQLGTDQLTFQPEESKWKSPSPSKMGTKKNSSYNVNKSEVVTQNSNFTLGRSQFQQQNQFVSLNREAMESIKTGDYNSGAHERELVGQRVKDVRQAHFNLGNQPVSYISQAGSSMIQHSITGDDVDASGAHMQMQKDRMRKANFKLPYTQSMQTEKSTYKACISNLAQSDSLNPGKAIIMSNLKDTSIQLGNQQNQALYITENQNEFFKKPVNVTKSIDAVQTAKLKENLKKNHFELGYGPNGHVLNTGGSSRIMSTNKVYNGISQQGVYAQKQNQRAHNFNLGYEHRPMSGTNVSSYIKKQIQPSKAILFPGSVQAQYPKNRTIQNGQISARSVNWGFS